VDNGYERCDPRDPCRCQGIVQGGPKAGQCEFKAVPGSMFCPMHGGAPQIDANRKYQAAKYRLEQYGTRVREFASDDMIKSLRDEIGILRMTLENVVNQCKNANQLVMFVDKISHLVNQIRQTVESTHKLEEKTAQLLDRRVIVIIADSIVQIIGEHVKDPDILQVMGSRICASIEAAASPEVVVGSGT
jgi:hypothetical protein